MIRILFIIYSFFSFISKAHAIDTLRLYRNQCGMRYNVYKWELFIIKGRNSYSYNMKTRQDSIIINPQHEKCYCIFYDRKNRKMYEGPLENGVFKGTVVFYYKSGKIKKTETYDMDTTGVIWIDIPYEMGTWKYYKRTGRLYKQLEFITLSKTDHNKTWYYRISISSRISKKGKIKTKRTILMDETTA